MRRRDFVAGAAAFVAVSRSFRTNAQQAARRPRIGVLIYSTPEQDPNTQAFVGGLRQLGYADGQNIAIDYHAMREIAEEAFAMVRQYKGSHSGEHGDGLVRSEFNEPMFGARLARAFEELKDRFDPKGFFNPGKIVRPPKLDDRRLFRYAPGYHGEPVKTHLDWSAYPGSGGGFQGAVEMCNNNGACRKLTGGVMCPSYRVTRDERDVTRGRANTLRLAVTGQLGAAALIADEMADTLKLCVSCKACRRECPTGVDMVETPNSEIKPTAAETLAFRPNT